MDDHLPKPLIKNIAFFGDAEVPETDSTYQSAFKVAKNLAENGYTIVNGGGPGVMNASTQGAIEGHGETISVTFDPRNATGFEGRYVGNVTTTEVKTKNYIERMFKLMEHSDVFVIFKGGSGTISEFGTAWVLAKLYYGHHKPFILFGHFWAEIIDAFKKNMNITADELAVFDIVDRVEDVLPTIKRLEKRLEEIDHSECRVCSESAFMT
jgi:uncharacterized protein (TIGR00730 family)